jgi:hypothetical protein
VLNQRSVILIKFCTKLKGECFLIRYFSYTQNVIAQCKKPTAQTAHLVFADTRANAEKPKELFFANARQKQKMN